MVKHLSHIFTDWEKGKEESEFVEKQGVILIWNKEKKKLKTKWLKWISFEYKIRRDKDHLWIKKKKKKLKRRKKLVIIILDER